MADVKTVRDRLTGAEAKRAAVVAARRAEWLRQARLPHVRSRNQRAMVDFNVSRFHDYTGAEVYGVAMEFSGDSRRGYAGQGRPADGYDIRMGLRLLGWTERPTPSGTRMVHPDGMVQVRFEPHGQCSERTYFEPVR